jgi:hypothetical protein
MNRAMKMVQKLFECKKCGFISMVPQHVIDQHKCKFIKKYKKKTK